MTSDRRPGRRALLALVLTLVVLLAPAAALAQGSGDASSSDAGAQAGCGFTKREAIEANGGPLGSAIWGRLCQVIDGKAAFAGGVEITVTQGDAVIGNATTGADGTFVIEIPGNGLYTVALDAKTLPKGFSLTDPDRATLRGFRVNLGDQQATFRLGADTRGHRSFADYATTFAKGLRLGLIIAVAAVGLSLVYGVTGLINFAHAELVTFGGIVAFTLNQAGIPFWLAVPLAVVAGAAIGYANDLLLWRPLRRRRMALLSQMVVSIGLSIAARNLFQVIFGPDSKRYSAARGQRESAYGPFRLTPNDLRVIVICVVVLGATTLLLRRTRLGTAIRATADNPDLASSSGIAVERIVAIVWALCGALAALGGILYGLTLNVTFDMGFVLLLSMFAAVVLGGLGNAYGAVIGAVVIGVVQEMSGLFIDTAYKFVVALAVLIVVLLVRPQGILGSRERFG